MPEPVDILNLVPLAAETVAAMGDGFRYHDLWQTPDREAFLAAHGDAVRGIARGSAMVPVGAELMSRLPNLEIVASLGVGYDLVDVGFAAGRGVIVTNTPDVLTEETADTAMALLLMTVRELSAAERYLRAGRWMRGAFYPDTASLRDRTVGIIGLGRIGSAIARRVTASAVPVVYHSRHPRPKAPYRYYPDLLAMARDVDTLVAVLPGGKGTEGIIGAAVFEALGPRGIFINIGRGSTVDEEALIAALRDRRILGAGLDVFRNEPEIDRRFLDLPNTVLLPHVGSSSVHTRAAMDRLVGANLAAWFKEGRPLTPVAETPWPR